MQRSRRVVRLPSVAQLLEARSDPNKLKELGELAVEQVLLNLARYDKAWVSRLMASLAQLKDEIDSKAPGHGPASKLMVELLQPEQVVRWLSRAEAAEMIDEPSEEEAEGIAWGVDLAITARLFGGAAVSAALATLAFAIVTYGFDPPGTIMMITFITIGGIGLACAAGLLGRGLYRHYVLLGVVDWDSRGWTSADVNRREGRQNDRRWRLWYVYTAGGLFISAGVALGFVIKMASEVSFLDDYTNVRLALLASTAIGLVLSAYGAWPIVHHVVASAEAERRRGGRAYAASPRLLLTVLPLFTGGIALLINLFFV